MKKVLVVALAVAIALVGAAAALADVLGTDHDMRTTAGYDGTIGETCVFCHTPHQTTAMNMQLPLWNRTLSANGFAVYSTSGSLDSAPAALAAGAIGSATLTHLCMSCHDGTVAVNQAVNVPNGYTNGTAYKITGSANLGTTLADDHPVNFVYDATLVAADGGLASALTVTTAGLPLDSNNFMQCSTCHDVHDNTNAPFLRLDNTDSGLCTTCHTNK